MVIVAEAMRGGGLGRKLMDQAMALAGDRPLRLIATQDGLPLYRKLGFVDQGEIVQHQGPVVSLDSTGDVEPATADDLPAIKALDRRAFGADRATLIDALSHQAQFAVIRRSGRVEAYAALRTFGRGHVVGPVVASKAEDAKSLITTLAARLPGAFVRVDTAVMSGLASWLTEVGLVHAGGGMVMNRPAATATAEDGPQIFALANQALG
jgi:predicted N-acetyltransferase YhbS